MQRVLPIGRAALPIGLLAAVVATAICSALAPYSRFIVGELAVFIILAAGVNIIMGVAGMFSVASPAFLGIGATATAALMVHGVPLLLSVLISLVGGWLLGWLLGLITLRLAGIYLAIVSLAFLQAVRTVLEQGGSITGGGYGLVVPLASLPGIGQLSVDTYAEMAVFIAALVCAISYAVTKSRTGRGWIAMKEHPAAAELQGVRLTSMRTKAFAFGSAIITLSGALYALILGITNPSSYAQDTAVTHLSYVVVGGMTPSVVGPIAGPTVLFLIPQLFKSLGSYLSLFYAGLMIIVLAVAPRGIAGVVTSARESLWTRSRSTRRQQAPKAEVTAHD